MGTSFVLAGIAILVGTPIAGAVLGDFGEVEWQGTIGFCAAGLMLATSLYVAARVMLYKERGGLRF
jgi:hypothetical protein